MARELIKTLTDIDPLKALTLLYHTKEDDIINASNDNLDAVEDFYISETTESDEPYIKMVYGSRGKWGVVTNLVDPALSSNFHMLSGFEEVTRTINQGVGDEDSRHCLIITQPSSIDLYYDDDTKRYSVDNDYNIIRYAYIEDGDNKNAILTNVSHTADEVRFVSDALPDSSYRSRNDLGPVRGYTAYFVITEHMRDIYTSEYVFTSIEDAYNYLDTGDPINAIQVAQKEKPAKDRLAELYYNSVVVRRPINGGADTVERVGRSDIIIKIQYATNDGTLISNPNRAIVGYVNINNEPNDMTSHFGNIIWVAKQGTKITELRQIGPLGGWEGSGLPNFANTTGFYGPYIYDGYIYESDYNTNMLIFANQNDALAYLSGSNSVKAIGGGRGKFNDNKIIGDKTVYNTSSGSPETDMSSCWILNANQVDELANIFATGLTTWESDNNNLLVNQLISTERSFYAHSEPINAVCDLFWLPIDPTEFCNTSLSHISFVRDTYGLAETVGKFVDSTGSVVKTTYSNPWTNYLLPGGMVINAMENIGEMGDKLSSVVDQGAFTVKQLYNNIGE